jgi:cellulose synthase/poly-beta-1,6-N-acetylglucosamine synthase-like glycosyltransferase
VSSHSVPTSARHRGAVSPIKTAGKVLSVVSVDYPHIAVLVPCYNEEVAILIVVCDFHEVLPNATIYVYDNNSQDRTIELARAAGAVVGTETLRGKGNVVRPCSPISRPTCIFSSTA